MFLCSEQLHIYKTLIGDSPFLCKDYEKEIITRKQRIKALITNSDFAAMAESLEKLGEENGLKVTVMHENIFNCMHHI